MEIMTETTQRQVQPITVPEAVQALQQTIQDIVRKNRTLVDYYIYPKQVPSEIEAYKPRLQILYGRLDILARLDLQNLQLLVDDATALVVSHLLPIVDQLLNAVHGIQVIFINHYDRDLEHRKPYNAIYQSLEYRESQLKTLQESMMRSNQRRGAELYNPIPSPPTPAFCRYAIAFANGRDQGKLLQVMSEDLLPEHRERLRSTGGAYLWWDCPGCGFKIRYHIANSHTSNIHLTDEIKTHSHVQDVQYRAAWLVKCHLHQAKTDDDAVEDEPKAKREIVSGRRGLVRRQTEYRSERRPSLWFGVPRRSVGEVNFEKMKRRESESLVRHKYGCPFCFAIGRPLQGNTFSTGRDLADHISARHHPGRPLPTLLLEKYAVGLNGKISDRVRRWDLNIK